MCTIYVDRKNIRRQTIHFCPICPDQPDLRYLECFDLYHTNLPDSSNQFQTLKALLFV